MELVTFVSLLVGLVVGEHTVVLDVSKPVDHVDLVLDGQTIGVVKDPPWSFRHDFGDELQPHELIAVARGSDGKELARARQWINLPRGLVEAQLTLEGRANAEQRTARLTWSNIYGTQPSRIEVFLDDELLKLDVPLDGAPPRSIRLPASDPYQPHFLHAELDFGAYGSATADLAFGAGFGEQVWTELTGVPVLLDKKNGSFEVQELDGWFLSNSDPVKVTRVAMGGANIKVVIGSEARIRLRQISQGSREMFHNTRGQPRSVEKLRGARAKAPQRHGEAISVFWPIPKQLSQDGIAYEIFEAAGAYDRDYPVRGNDLAFLKPTQAAEGPQKLAEAVATAGLAAAAGGHRRAVVLIMVGDDPDSSGISPQAAVAFLQRLHVPLYVWSPSNKTPRQGPWGEVEHIPSLRALSGSYKRLSKTLARQRVVWLDGAYLPQSIELSPQAEKLRIVQ